MANELFYPIGQTTFEKALDKATYQDATLAYLEMAEQGDTEMQEIVFSRVYNLTGKKPTSLRNGLRIMLEDF